MALERQSSTIPLMLLINILTTDALKCNQCLRYVVFVAPLQICLDLFTLTAPSQGGEHNTDSF